MSGPKVVRIVTREEILALCEGHLARVDAAMAEWLRIGRRNDCRLGRRHRPGRRANGAAARLLRADRFMDLQKQAPQEIAFLHQDMQSRLAKVADVAAQAPLGLAAPRGGGGRAVDGPAQEGCRPAGRPGP